MVKVFLFQTSNSPSLRLLLPILSNICATKFEVSSESHVHFHNMILTPQNDSIQVIRAFDFLAVPLFFFAYEISQLAPYVTENHQVIQNAVNMEWQEALPVLIGKVYKHIRIGTYSVSAVRWTRMTRIISDSITSLQKNFFLASQFSTTQRDFDTVSILFRQGNGGTGIHDQT